MVCMLATFSLVLMAVLFTLFTRRLLTLPSPVRSVSLYQAGLAIYQRDMDEEELECALALQIHRQLLKAYISRSKRCLVLSKGQAFPSPATLDWS